MITNSTTIKKVLGLVAMMVTFAALPLASYGQQDTSSYTRVRGKLVVQVSGVVVEASSQMPLMGVHIYVPRYGRGTTSDINGFFSDVFLEGDSILISAIGYEKQWVVITDEQGDQFTTVIELEEDTTYLSQVDVLPYPTERQFREAVLALSDPDIQRQMQLARALDDDSMARMLRDLPLDGAGNYRYMMDQQFYNQYNNGVRGIPLLNPFAWGELLKSIKRGDFRRDD